MKFYKIAAIALSLGVLSTPVQATVISLNQTIIINQSLNDQNPTISGSFDLSAVLSGITNAYDMTNVSAVITASGYSALDNVRTETYGSYSFIGSETRQTFPGASYTESYPCGFRTCYRTIIVPPRYTTDNAYARNLDIRNIDDVIDEMLVEIGPATYTDTVDTHNTDFRYNRYMDYSTGTHGGGYNFFYTDERRVTDQYFGSLSLNQDISGLIASSIDFTQDILNWSMMANIGQFRAQQISLQLSFNRTTDVPEPDMAFLFGAGFAYLGWRSRRRQRKSL
ncbi:hypothetical protein MNBD_ALPHA01-712 [hydrothermal vent metagenome]|uniref:PEP-CTERM protein-sorting domain-containing protein n=1 Tax=hydrothermal vent metagenome TaxID=652676 RepID=A0A3B0S5E9_9ZZZZ